MRRVCYFVERKGYNLIYFVEGKGYNLNCYPKLLFEIKFRAVKLKISEHWIIQNKFQYWFLWIFLVKKEKRSHLIIFLFIPLMVLDRDVMYQTIIVLYNISSQKFLFQSFRSGSLETINGSFPLIWWTRLNFEDWGRIF